jgi:hypothetical protein
MESKLEKICKDFKTTRSYSYRIPKIINVTLNNSEKKNVIYDGEIIIDLEPPIIVDELYLQLNKSFIPGRLIKPYTYAIIELEKILFLPLFKDEYKTLTNTLIDENGNEIVHNYIDANSDIGKNILLILRTSLLNYIIRGNDNKEYIVFFRVVGSNFELFNKHGSFIAYLKNIILDNLCEFFDEEKMKNHMSSIDSYNFGLDIDNYFYRLFFFYGSAGELLLNRIGISSFNVNYNFFSGTLMEIDYNTKQRNIIATNVFKTIVDNLDSSNRYILINTNKNLITDIDKTDDAIALIKRGIKLYYIYDDELIKAYSLDGYLSNFTKYFTKLKISINKLYSLIGMLVPDIDKTVLIRIKGIQERLRNIDYKYEDNIDIKIFINELLLNTNISSNRLLKNLIQGEILNEIENLNNYFIIKEKIKELMIPENIVNEGELKRSRGIATGGKINKETKKQRKNRRYGKSKKQKKNRRYGKSKKTEKIRKHKK